MYAIVDQGGRQVRMAEGELVQIDYREAAEPGEELTFDRVLMIGGAPPQFGSPTLAGARVTAVVRRQLKGPKLHGNKRRLHKRSRTRWGHRQRHTLVEIVKISIGGFAVP